MEVLEQIEELKKELLGIERNIERTTKRSMDWNSATSEFRRRRNMIQEKIDNLANPNHFTKKFRESYSVKFLDISIVSMTRLLELYREKEVVTNKEEKIFIDTLKDLRLQSFRVINELQ